MLTETQIATIEDVANCPIGRVMEFTALRLDHLFDSYDSESEVFSDGTDILLTSWEINYFFYGQEDTNYGPQRCAPEWLDPDYLTAKDFAVELRLARAARLMWLAACSDQIENASSAFASPSEYDWTTTEVMENLKQVKIHYPQLFA